MGTADDVVGWAGATGTAAAAAAAFGMEAGWPVWAVGSRRGATLAGPAEPFVEGVYTVHLVDGGERIATTDLILR